MKFQIWSHDSRFFVFHHDFNMMKTVLGCRDAMDQDVPLIPLELSLDKAKMIMDHFYNVSKTQFLLLEVAKSLDN